MKPEPGKIKNLLLPCKHCITGETEVLDFHDPALVTVNEPVDKEKPLFFSGPGLVDLQINGIHGIDFNVPSLTVDEVVNAAQFLLSQGITTFFPTVITNSDDHILTIVHTLAEACKNNPLVDACIGGIHLEGPFISPLPGAKGAHNENYIKAPDWELFDRFQAEADGRIKIITLAPEWEAAPAFIEKAVRSGVIVSIGHSLADTSQVKRAVEAGARMSTHLGNGIPLMLQRHPNLIWDQLAEEDLTAGIIADGIHLPDAFIKVVRKVKDDSMLVVSDATCYAGMPPGEYHSHIGGDVVLDKNKRVSLKGASGLLAGAAKSLLENVETLLEHGLCPLAEAWQMASMNPIRFLKKNNVDVASYYNDRVVFALDGASVAIKMVIKDGKVVFNH